MGGHHGGEEAVGGLNGCFPGVEQHKAAGPIGVLGLQWLAPLAQHCRLLIPQAPCGKNSLLKNSLNVCSEEACVSESIKGI